MSVNALGARCFCFFVIFAVVAHAFTVTHLSDVKSTYQDELKKCRKQHDKAGVLSHYRCDISINKLMLTTAVRG